jgi:hypothetical protein
MGPTSANMCPLRVVFVKSREAKERLLPALDAGNVAKTLAAPVTAILGMEIQFYEQLPKLFPHADARAWFKDLPNDVSGGPTMNQRSCAVDRAGILKRRCWPAPSRFAPPEVSTLPAGASIMGKLEFVEYDSKVVGLKRRAQVYTPPGYFRDQMYPGLYRLHGIGGGESECALGGSPDVILNTSSLSSLPVIGCRQQPYMQVRPFAPMSVQQNDLQRSKCHLWVGPTRRDPSQRLLPFSYCLSV